MAVGPRQWTGTGEGLSQNWDIDSWAVHKIIISSTVVLKLGCTLELPAGLLKILMWIK